MRLGKRVEALEAGNGGPVHPAIKQWLGWSLTDAERERLSDPLPEPDLSKLDKELAAWLAT